MKVYELKDLLETLDDMYNVELDVPIKLVNSIIIDPALKTAYIETDYETCSNS